MNSKLMLKEMFALQQKLNDETNGLDWEKGYNKHNRIINWRRCITMECAELIDSFNWKHWKDINIAPDWDNITIELVDIWHFVMSLGLEFYKNRNLGDIDDIVNYVLDTKYFDEFCNDASTPNEEDALSIVNSIEHMMKDTLLQEDFYKITDDFFSTAIECGLNLEILYKYYLGKNILNGFRQDHGYKEGTYIKVWQGKEDNDVMMSILDAEENLTASSLYNRLKEAYSKVS
jgi:dimeric dUTPase (all-alpha-NTP-PPase superfamily)